MVCLSFTFFMSEVQLGFIEDADDIPKHIASIPDIPDKIGGLPIWLAPVTVDPSLLNCGSCSEPMCLLLQLYCPEDTLERIVYVFTCKKGECHSKRADDWYKWS
jgi:pre-rRNA-processing protein TSR4